MISGATRQMMRRREYGFVTTWLTTESDETITLPLVDGFNYDMHVKWGDGETSHITAHNDPARIHTFEVPGTQEIHITGLCEAWAFADGGDKLKFRTVENWGYVGFTGLGLEDAFWGCVNATNFGKYIPYCDVTSLTRTWRECQHADAVFPDITRLTDVTTLQACWRDARAKNYPEINSMTWLTDINSAWNRTLGADKYPDIDKLINVETIYSCWWNTNDFEGPYPAVNTLVKVKDFSYTWRYCSSAEYLPDVSNLTAVEDMRFSHADCTSLKQIPALPAAAPELWRTRDAFNGIGSGMKGTTVALWDTALFPKVTIFANTFTDATGLTNYGSIPDNWKGL